MKLRFTQQELEEGFSVRRLGEKQKAEIASEMTTLGVFPISPIPLDGKWASAVILDKLEPEGDKGFHKITLRPIAVPVYEVHEKGGDLNALVLELPEGQMQVDALSIRKVRLTLSGPGADPEMVRKAQVAFGKLVASDKSHPAVRRAVEYLKTQKKAA